MVNQIANILSAIRIPMSISLFFITPVMSLPFKIVYVLAFLTDMVDGTIARKTNSVTEFGSKLDSYADLTFMLAFLFVVVPWMDPPLFVIILVIICFILKVIPFILTRMLLGEFKTFHNKFAKVGFFCVMLLPLLFEYFGYPLVYFVLGLMYVASLYDYYIYYNLRKEHLAKKAETSQS